MEQSDSIAALAKALAAASAEYPKVIKGREVDSGKYKYHYADLADLMETVRPTLSKHGLSVAQMLEPHGPGFITEDGEMRGIAIGLTTMLMHESGEWMCSTFTLPSPSAAAQTVGSVITYARRYAYQSIIGIATEEDDDGAAASTPPARREQAARPKATEQQQNIEDPGAFVLPFGKHKGKTLREAGRHYAQYLVDKINEGEQENGKLSPRDEALREVMSRFLVVRAAEKKAEAEADEALGEDKPRTVREMQADAQRFRDEAKGRTLKGEELKQELIREFDGKVIEDPNGEPYDPDNDIDL